MKCPEHGAVYVKGCAGCRAYSSARKRERREQLRGTPVPDYLHGKEGTYEDYGCRCGPCTYAYSHAVRQRYSRAQMRKKQ